ncbi:MAG: RHS repeat-associated core domain-containing protein [Opitutaceae bacterium]|nr:RHS repeat-associated core domain-containing protein [Opitutaceae bacterium]
MYPTGFQTRQVYNAFGYLKEVRQHVAGDDGKPNHQLAGHIYWMADSYAVTGQVDGEILGNGLINDRVYSAKTGRLQAAAVGRGIETAGPFSVQTLHYTRDAVGNVTGRVDSTTGVARTESFTYDALDRLTGHTVNSGTPVTVSYDAQGNITQKSDVGSYLYGSGRPHAVSGVTGGPLGNLAYAYDANGNLTTGGGRTLTWTSFNQVRSVTQGSFTSTFSFGANRERVKQVSHLGTTIYVGSLYEKFTAGSAFEHKHYIMAPTGRVAVHIERSDLTQAVRYFHSDGLGSITAVTNEWGAVEKRFAYDAWGKRIDPGTGSTITGSTAAGYSRGFTDHEQLDDLGLIHMNGRIYDPVLGRFLSADPFVDDAGDSQSYNRYSYVSNNPLGYTDPSGYIKLSFKTILKIVAVVAIAYFTAGAAISAWGTTMTTSGSFAAGTATVTVTAGSTFATMMPVAIGNGIIGGLAGGFASGFAGSLLNGGSIGDAFKAGVIGGVAGAVGGGIAGAFSDAGLLTRTVAASAVGGATSEAMGGSFRDGALIAGAVTLANFGWQKAKEFTDETAYKAARTAEASGTEEGKRLAQELRVTDPTGNPRTDGKIPSVKGNEWGPKWLNRLLSPLDRRLENTGMARQGSDGHGYDRAKWTGGQDGWVSRNINDVSKLHDWFNGWSYDSVTGYHVTHGPLFNTAFAAYSFGGMVPAWALTNVALTNPSVSIQAYNQDRRRP